MLRTLRFTALAAASGVALALPASAQDMERIGQQFVTGNHEIKQLILNTVRTGQSQERVFAADETFVRAMRVKLGTNGPVKMKTAYLNSWKQRGCARVRLDVTIVSATFVRQRGGMVDVPFSMSMNVCEDGSPPMETQDLRDLNRYYGAQDVPATQESKPIPVTVDGPPPRGLKANPAQPAVKPKQQATPR